MYNIVYENRVIFKLFGVHYKSQQILFNGFINKSKKLINRQNKQNYDLAKHSECLKINTF